MDIVRTVGEGGLLLFCNFIQLLVENSAFKDVVFYEKGGKAWRLLRKFEKCKRTGLPRCKNLWSFSMFSLLCSFYLLFWHLCFLCSTSLVKVTSSYTEDEPKESSNRWLLSLFSAQKFRLYYYITTPVQHPFIAKGDWCRHFTGYRFLACVQTSPICFVALGKGPRFFPRFFPRGGGGCTQATVF